jgi:acyl-CoA synthetase (NDP forming)
MSPQHLIDDARRVGRSALDESAGKALLAAYGVAVPRGIVLSGADDVRQQLHGLKAPYVVKVVSPDLLHKSDVGGVKVNLRSADDVSQAIAAMMQQPTIAASRIDGFLVEEMAPRGQEVVVGGLRDPDFGPLVMVGLGGIFVEILADVAFRICPVTALDAEEMIGELKGNALLHGARGAQAVSKSAIVDTLLKLGGEHGLLMRHADTIKEADVNPLIVSAEGAVAVDARFILG